MSEIIRKLVESHLEKDKIKDKEDPLRQLLNSDPETEKKYKLFLTQKYKEYEKEINDFISLFKAPPQYTLNALDFRIDVKSSHERLFIFDIMKEDKNVIAVINSWSSSVYLTESKKLIVHSATNSKNINVMINHSSDYLKNSSNVGNMHIVSNVCNLLNDMIKEYPLFRKNVEEMLKQVEKASNFIKHDVNSKELEIINNKDLLSLKEEDFDLLKLTEDTDIRSKILKIQGIIRSENLKIDRNKNKNSL